MADTAHGTLTANQVTTVTITSGYGGIEVVNRDMQGAIWVRLDGTNPQVAGADSYVVLGARSFPTRKRGAVTVKMVSDADRAYSVEAA